MNIAAHNPKFLNGLSITRLLSRIAILTSQLVGAKKQITTMTSQIMDLTSQNTAYLQRINELERSATLDSNNSCKPPSSDGLRKPNGKKDKDKKDKDKKKRTNSLREKSGRKSGGQPGHEGNTLKQVADPDEIIDILPEQCPNCQTEFSLENSTGCVHRQVFDLPPPPPPLVVEYRRHTCKCAGCGDEFKGQFPADVTAPVQYGKRVASYVTYYQTSQVVPGNRLVEILRDMHGMKASEATVMKMIGDSAQRLKPVYDLLQKKIAGDPNITTHLDETGFRTEEKLHWVHTTSSKTMSHFRVGNSRGDILLDLAGNVIHDCYAPYWKILGVKHGTCNFHITRELKALFEIDNEPWAGEMRIILFDALKLTGNAREQGKDAVDPKDISAIEERFYACLKKAIAYHESLDPLVSPTRWRTHNFVDFTFIFDTLQKNSKQEKSMARSDMRDFEWDFIKKLLPNKSRGVKRVDDRRVINGILYALRTGIPWRDMPEQYGLWSTIYNRFNRWSKAGIWDMIFEAIVDSHNVDTVMVDSTSVRAHPTAAKLKKTDKRRCLGRSRGGLGTKIHASNNQDGLPLKLELTPNQANDAPPCGTLLTGLQPGQWVLADKAYDVNWIRNMIWEQGAIDVIPSKSNRKIPKEFDKVMYRQRNKIERFFGRLKASFRRIATRYEHTSANFLAMIKLACVRLWLEFYEYAA